MRMHRVVARLALALAFGLSAVVAGGTAAQADPPLWQLWDDYGSESACLTAGENLDGSLGWSTWKCTTHQSRYQLWYKD